MDYFFWKTKHKDAYRIDLEQLSPSSIDTDLKSSNYNSDGSLSAEKYINRTYSDSKIKKKNIV